MYSERSYSKLLYYLWRTIRPKSFLKFDVILAGHLMDIEFIMNVYHATYDPISTFRADPKATYLSSFFRSSENTLYRDIDSERNVQLWIETNLSQCNFE